MTELEEFWAVLDWRRYPPSAWALIGTNILAPVAAVALGASPAGIVWAYWLESVVIGGFTILAFLTMSVRSLLAREAGGAFTPIVAALFFAIHYGGFHAGYALFLSFLPWFSPGPSDIAGVGLAALILSASHAFSFFRNVLGNPSELENNGKNISRVMSAPYGRIIPMHIAIILSGFVLMPFMLLFSAIFSLAFAMTGGAGAEAAEGAFIWVEQFVAMLLFVMLKCAGDLFGHIRRYRKDNNARAG